MFWLETLAADEQVQREVCYNFFFFWRRIIDLNINKDALQDLCQQLGGVAITSY